jgi:hypothetical protein
VEGAENEEYGVFNEMGAYLSSFLREDLYIRREILQ